MWISLFAIATALAIGLTMAATWMQADIEGPSSLY
jgi:hypothetical protein